LRQKELDMNRRTAAASIAERYQKAGHGQNSSQTRSGSLNAFELFQKNVEEGRRNGLELSQLKLENIAKDAGLKQIGSGGESTVFDLAKYSLGIEKVLKIFYKEEVARGEYVIFADPKYQDVTPRAFDHDEEWRWITVEKLQPLEGWRTFYEQFESLYNHIFKPEVGYVPSNPGYELSKIIEREEEWSDKEYEDLFSKEAIEWMNQIRNLHEDLGLEVKDLAPRNMGLDRRGNIVLLDIYIEQVL
jgi:hypothetical protein